MASNAKEIRISPTVAVAVYYDPEGRAWWAYYFSQTPGEPLSDSGNQIGDAWFGPTRDDVLVFRPAAPGETP